MAEVIAGVAVASSFIQLIDFGSKIIRRLYEYQSASRELPKVFRSLQDQLPLLIQTLEQIKTTVDKKPNLNADPSADSLKIALSHVVRGCQKQLELLDNILEKTLPQSDSWRERSKKAIVSVTKESEFKRISASIREYVNTLTFYHTVASNFKGVNDEDEILQLRHWISAPDPNLNYFKALSQHLANTGAWFLNSDRYIDWKSEANSLLWLHGIPGCGKTILSAAIIQDLLQQHTSGIGVVYFYFDFNTSAKQVSENMFRSIFSQLCQQCVVFPDPVKALYKACSLPRPKREPSSAEILSAIQEMIQAFPCCFLVLDALDECADRGPVTRTLQDLQSQIETLHILVTSRKERDIELGFESFVDQEFWVDLQSSVVDEDIRLYVQQRWSQGTEFKRWKSNEVVQKEVEEALMQKAHGMFRWAVCQLDELGKCVNLKRLRWTLATLPKTLDETYERILCNIEDYYQDYALRILRWLAFAPRPLTVLEVAEIVAVDVEGDGCFNEDEVLPEPLDVVTICSSLVTTAPLASEERVILKDDGTLGLGIVVLKDLDVSKLSIRLAHYSVQEYLVSDRMLSSKAAIYHLEPEPSHANIAQGCLTYLLRLEDPGMEYKALNTMFPLAEYAAQFWWTHFKEASETDIGKSTSFAERLFRARDDAFPMSIRLHNPEYRRHTWYRPCSDIMDPLFYCALQEIITLFQKLALEVDFNLKIQLYSALLTTSVSVRSAEILNVLLEAGKPTDFVSRERIGQLLYDAVSGGHSKIVEMLNAAVPDLDKKKALISASEAGHERVVDILITAGADVNAYAGSSNTALIAASERGNERIVKLLIASGADVNSYAGSSNTALIAASERGNERIVRLLIASGADVNAYAGSSNTALRAASERGNERIVRLLIASGADVNAHGGDYDTAVIAAPERGNTALIAASERGNERIVRLLIASGADVNAYAGSSMSLIAAPEQGNTALRAASERGNERIVRLLIASGANLNAHGGDYDTAVIAASERGNERIVRLLVDAGASVNLATVRTPLIVASQIGHERIVEVLIAAGADLNAQRMRRTALTTASEAGYARVVEILIAAGAKVKHWRHLAAVARNSGYSGIADMLTTAGAAEHDA